MSTVSFGRPRPGMFSRFVTPLLLLLARLGACLLDWWQVQGGLETVFGDTVKKGQRIADIQQKLLASAEAAGRGLSSWPRGVPVWPARPAGAGYQGSVGTW